MFKKFEQLLTYETDWIREIAAALINIKINYRIHLINPDILIFSWGKHYIEIYSNVPFTDKRRASKNRFWFVHIYKSSNNKAPQDYLCKEIKEVITSLKGLK